MSQGSVSSPNSPQITTSKPYSPKLKTPKSNGNIAIKKESNDKKMNRMVRTPLQQQLTMGKHFIWYGTSPRPDLIFYDTDTDTDSEATPTQVGRKLSLKRGGEMLDRIQEEELVPYLLDQLLEE